MTRQSVSICLGQPSIKSCNHRDGKHKKWHLHEFSSCWALQQMTFVLVTSTFASSAGMPLPSCWAGPWSPPQPPSFPSGCYASAELFRWLYAVLQPSWEKPAWTSSLSNSSAFKATIFSVKCLNSTTPARHSYSQISWYLHRYALSPSGRLATTFLNRNEGFLRPKGSIQGKTGKSKIIKLQDKYYSKWY